MGRCSILDNRTLTSSEGIVEGLLTGQFAAGDDSSAVRVTAAARVEEGNVDAWTTIGYVVYAMLSGSHGKFFVNNSLASSLTFGKGYFYVKFKDPDGTPGEAALELTAPISNYLNGGSAEGLYQDILAQLQKANLAGGTFANFIEAPALGLGEVADSGGITVDVGQGLAEALGLTPGATLEAIGKAFVGFKYHGFEYTAGSAVVITEFRLTKSGAQIQLRAASNAGTLVAFSDNTAPTTGSVGFFPATGFSPQCTSTLQDANGDVGGVLNDLSSDQAYNKFMAIAATISIMQL